jgi:hypothetical protein
MENYIYIEFSSPKYYHFAEDIYWVEELVNFQEPESYIGGSIVGRVSLAGQVEGQTKRSTLVLQV